MSYTWTDGETITAAKLNQISHDQLFESGSGANSIVALNGDYVDNTAAGATAFAGGVHSSASGAASFAYGSKATASGNYSVAFGGSNASINNGNGPTAQGSSSLAVGLGTQATGARSATFGLGTVASGDQSVAMGDRTIAAGKSQTVIGQYNIEDTNTDNETTYGSGARDYLFIVGNGDSTARSNALTLDWDGNVKVAGKVTVGAAPANDMDAATKKYVDDNIPSTAADVGAVASNQGVGNAGKFMVVGSDGMVVLVTMATWQGGSY